MPIAIIVAAAGKNLVIGRDGDLPWYYKADLKYFKEKTIPNTVLMGRVTYQSIFKRLGKPLPERQNVVLTREAGFQADGITVIHSLSEISRFTGSGKWLFIIGGAEIYRQMLDQADRLYLTHIDREIEGDAFFPWLDPKIWLMNEEKRVTEDGANLRFCIYQRAP
jgi:dihydrofolate reductase